MLIHFISLEKRWTKLHKLHFAYFSREASAADFIGITEVQHLVMMILNDDVSVKKILDAPFLYHSSRPKKRKGNEG